MDADLGFEAWRSGSPLYYFGSTLAVQLPSAAEAIRRGTKSGDLKAASAFAIGAVANIKSVSAAYGHKVRIIEDPEPSNGGHAEIRRYPRDAGELYQELAEEVFRPRYLYGSIAAPEWTP